MPLIDHLFVILIAGVYPVVGFVSFRRLLKRVAAGETVNRPQLYRHTFLIHWALMLACLLLWAAHGRDWVSFGFGTATGAGFFIAALLTAAGIAALALQIRKLRSATHEELERARSGFGDVSLVIPRTRGELARFYGLSVTAGIVEEALWRGYLIWYLVQFMPVWAAGVLSAVGFGLAHAYQGARQVPQIVLVGAVLTALYLISGSLWLPMIMHAAIDILQGRLAYELLGGRGDDPGRSVGHGVNDVVDGETVSE